MIDPPRNYPSEILAIAIHPRVEKNRHLVGKNVVVPIMAE